ncbi:bacterial transcriptional activator domain-containing protein [Actinoplanes missouriensis]|uniref:AfsR/SARP family transcriptional regulator n=1 Tax=Actinoplanes missouriensis TaxID=1866 RepID=UPI0033E4E75F
MTLHYLRRVLEPDLSSRCPSRFIHTDAGRYWFDPQDSWWTDVDEMRQLWTPARAADDAAIPALNRLLDYYRQGFLPEELYADAFAGFRDAHSRGHDEALHTLLGLYRDRGRRYETLTCAQQILDRDPYSEPTVTVLVEAHLEQGNRRAAIAELDRFLRVQGEDLGVKPSRHLLALRQRVTGGPAR